LLSFCTGNLAIDQLSFVFTFSDFAWSPGDNVISYWLPEIKDTPARVTIMAVPSRQELRVKNLFNVATVSKPLPYQTFKYLKWLAHLNFDQIFL
jgi:uncharacterized protein with WD repeat